MEAHRVEAQEIGKPGVYEAQRVECCGKWRPTEWEEKRVAAPVVGG